MKLKNIISSLYEYVLKCPFLSSLCVLLTCLNKDSLIREIYSIIIIGLLFSLVFQKRYEVKKIFLFGLSFSFVFLVRDLISDVISINAQLFGQLTIMFNGIELFSIIILKFIARFIAGIVVIFLVNFISEKLIKSNRLEKIIKPVSNFFQNPLKVIFVVIVIFSFINIFKCMTMYRINIKPYEELNRFNPNKIHFLDKEKIVLIYNDRFNIYDREKSQITDQKKFLIQNRNDYVIANTKYLFLRNGNIFIKQIWQKEDGKDKMSAFVLYSPKEKSVIMTSYLPDELTDERLSMVELKDGNIMIIGAKGENGERNRCYIFDIKVKQITKVAYLNVARADSKALLLDNGKVIVAGGSLSIPDNSIEIYDPLNNNFKHIPINFVMEECKGLYKLPKGEVLIFALRLYAKKEDGIGIYSSSYRGTGYPSPYITIYNPKNNTFRDIDINKNDRNNLKYGYSVAVTDDGKLIILGGSYIGRKKYILHGDNKNVTIYDTKRNTLKECTKKLNYYRNEPEIQVLDNSHIIVYLGRSFLKNKNDNSDFAEEIILSNKICPREAPPPGQN